MFFVYLLNICCFSFKNYGLNLVVFICFVKPKWNLNVQKRRRLPRDQDTPEYNLPAEFIEKQRAYFKEVDEFELLEEVASDNEN